MSGAPTNAPKADPVIVQSKPWYESIGSWGNIVSVVAWLATLLTGWVMTPGIQEALTQTGPQIAEAVATRNWAVLATAVFALVGTVLSQLGRNQADQRVHMFSPFTYTLAPTVLEGGPGTSITPKKD